MKRTILLATITLLVSMSAAVVGGPEPGEGEMAITSTGSSASGSTAVGPNGTEWSSKVEMTGRDSSYRDGSVENVSYSDAKTTFSGYIQAPTPCHVIDQETEETGGDSYTINIKTVKENQSQFCRQQVVMIKYDGSFEAGAPYTLEIRHNNQTIDTLENTASEDTTQKMDRGVIKGFFSWLGNLF